MGVFAGEGEARRRAMGHGIFLGLLYSVFSCVQAPGVCPTAGFEGCKHCMCSFVTIALASGTGVFTPPTREKAGVLEGWLAVWQGIAYKASKDYYRMHV